MGKIISFAEALARRQRREKAEHELSLQWTEQRTKVKAVCACGIEFARWVPEHGDPTDNLRPVRLAYREHVVAVTGQPLSYGAAYPVVNQ